MEGEDLQPRKHEECPPEMQRVSEGLAQVLRPTPLWCTEHEKECDCQRGAVYNQAIGGLSVKHAERLAMSGDFGPRFEKALKYAETMLELQAKDIRQMRMVQALWKAEEEAKERQQAEDVQAEARRAETERWIEEAANDGEP